MPRAASRHGSGEVRPDDGHGPVRALRARRRGAGDAARAPGRAAWASSSAWSSSAPRPAGAHEPRRALRRAPDVRGLRGPLRRGRRVHRRARGRASSGCAPRARRVPVAGSPSASTCTAPTAARSRRPRGTPTGRPWPTPPSTTPSSCAAGCRPRTRSTGWARRPGAHNRRGRDFTLWNTDVLDPDRARRSSPRAGSPATPARIPRGRRSTRTTCPSRSSTTTPTPPARSRRRSWTTGTAPPTTSRAGTSTRSTSPAGSTRSTSSPGPGWRTSWRPTRG
jgi:hypothetical protein